MKKYFFLLLITIMFSTVNVFALSCTYNGQNGVSVTGSSLSSTSPGNVAGFFYYTSSTNNGYVTAVCDTLSGPSDNNDLLYQNIIIQGASSSIKSVTTFSGFGAFSDVVKPSSDFFSQLIGDYNFGFGIGSSGYQIDNGFVYGFSAISTSPAKISFRVFVPQTNNGLVSFYTYDTSFDFIQGGSPTSLSSALNNFNNSISNYNTQSIIDNQNSNTQSQIDSQKSCQLIDSSSIFTKNKYLTTNNTFTNSTVYGVTDYINIYGATLTLINTRSGNSSSTCFYNQNKEKISCFTNDNLKNNGLNVPDGSYYIRASIDNDNKPSFKLCKDGNQALTDSLNDDNVNGAEKDASDFFSNFSTNTHGLTGIITAPLSAIESLTSATCSPLTLPLPFIDEDLELPCMRSVYEEFFGDFMDIYDVVVLGVLSYWIMVRIFAMVKDFKNPEHDEVEVMEL